MSLFRRGPAITVDVEPAVVMPTGEVRASVTLPDELDGVASARFELGYKNTFNYHWAGKRDAAARHDDTSLATIGQVGTSYGSTRDTDEWVHVLDQPLALMSGSLSAGTHQASLRVPSWAPGSGADLVEWAVRLVVDRKGRDVNESAVFEVLAPASKEMPAEMRQERLLGEACDIDIQLDRPAWQAGETIKGTVTITPREDMEEADVAMFLQRDRLSHPVARTPSPGQTFDGDRVTLGKHVALSEGVTVKLAFEVPLPRDAAPTAEAVNSSYVWFLQARVMIKGWGHGVDRVRRELVVYTA